MGGHRLRTRPALPAARPQPVACSSATFFSLSFAMMASSTRRFAWLMLTLLLAALAGDLVLLPALLVGPVGRIFLRNRSSAGR